MASFKSSSGMKSQINRKVDLEPSKPKTHTTIDPLRYKPMLLTDDRSQLGKKGWGWEVKEDGTRLITTITKDDIYLITTKGIEKSKVLPELKELGQNLNCKKNVVLDVEGVVLKNGVSDYPSAERRFGRQKKLLKEEEKELTEKYPVILMAFDILELDGKDLTQLPLKERKRILHQVLEGNTNPHIREVKTYNTEDALDLLKKAYDLKLEGIVGKRLDSKYNALTELTGWVKKRGEFKKTPDWVKEKTTSMMDVIIPGYMTGTGKRKDSIGSLLLACWDKEKNDWRFVGFVGTGFSDSDLSQLKQEFEKIPLTTQSFKGINAEKIRKKTGRQLIFFDPSYYEKSKIMRVRFQEYTPDTIMRIPVYEGFRDDIGAKDTHLEFKKFPPKELETMKIKEVIPINWKEYK